MLVFTLLLFIVWFIIQIIVRFAGHMIFNPNSPLLYILIFITIPLVYFLTYALYYRFQFTKEMKIYAASRIFSFLLLLEVPVFIYAKQLFPNMSNDAMLLYASYLFAFYALCFLTGTIRDPINRTPIHPLENLT